MTKQRILDIDNLTLYPGVHSPDSTFCVMEAVAYIAGEEWSDCPTCASPVIGDFLRAWNDTPEPYGSEVRRQIKQYIPRMVSSRGSADVEKMRSWMALDWLIRVQGPAWMDLTPTLRSHADTLRLLPPQISTDALTQSDPIRYAAGAAARAASGAAAWAAARAAAWAAAGDAAGDAAWEASGAAAGEAAWAAAWAAAGAVAGDAAWVAAGDNLAPTVALLQASAHDLINRMLEVSNATI